MSEIYYLTIVSNTHLLLKLYFLIRSRNNLLNGDTSTYDWDSGYTCHQLGSGSILVQLGQPYMIESMRYDSYILACWYNITSSITVFLFVQITTLGL